MSEDRLASSSFGDSNPPPLTPKQTPNPAILPSPAFETPKPTQGAFSEAGGLTPRFAEDYSVFNSTPGNLRGSQGTFPDFIPATPASSCGHKRLLSTEGFAAEIAGHVNHFSPNPNAPLPPVDPAHRLPSSPALPNPPQGDFPAVISSQPNTTPSKASSKKSLRVNNQDCGASQILSPPPSAHKREHPLSDSNMQNDQDFGHADFNDPSQQQELAAMMANSADLFGYPMSAPVSAPPNLWDPNMAAAMDLDFSAMSGSHMFPADASAHHHNAGSFDWNSDIQLFQDPNIAPPSSNQENIQPARRERALAPKPPATSIESSALAATTSHFTNMEDPFGIVNNGDAVDPGLLFSRPQTSESDFHSLSQPESATAASGKAPVKEPRRVSSAKGTKTVKSQQRAIASSPIKPSSRPGLARSFSENRGRKALGRGAMPALAPAARPIPQPGSGSGVESGRRASSGRISPLKSQKRLSGLASIPEAPALPRSRTSVRFTIDSHGRARAETTILAGEAASDRSIVRSQSSRDLSSHSWDHSEDDESTDDEPIVIPSRNASFSASFALPDPRKPVGSIFHSSRRSVSDRSSSTQNNDGESEAETVMDDEQDQGGDAASELRKVLEDRQKQAAKQSGNRSQRTFSADFGRFLGGTISPTSLTSSSQGFSSQEVRCICSRTGMDKGDGFMLQCESCEMWLHGECINITRRTMPSVYICGFCANTPAMTGNRGRDMGRGNALGISPISNKSFKSFR